MDLWISGEWKEADAEPGEGLDPELRRHRSIGRQRRRRGWACIKANKAGFRAIGKRDVKVRLLEVAMT